MAVKEFVERCLVEKGVVVLVSLDVQGAFDAAWWPCILNTLKQFECPRNLYCLSQSYFGGRKAVLSTHNTVHQWRGMSVKVVLRDLVVGQDFGTYSITRCSIYTSLNVQNL